MEGVGSPVEGSSGSYFTPLLISMAGVVCTTLAILAYHFIVVRFFLSRRRQRQRQLQEAAAAENLSSQPIGQNAFGVNEKVLSAIPILSYSTKNGQLFHVDRSECVICLGELEEGDMVRLLPNCKHVFHNSCIDKWFLAHTNCPVCRSAIAAPISSVTSLLVEDVHGHDDHDDDQVRDGDIEEASVNCSPHPHENPDQRGMGVLSNSTSMAVQLPKPDHGLLRHCVSLVLLPVEGNNNNNNNNNNKQSFETTSLERSLSLDQSHVLISIQTERDDIDKPSSSSPSSSSSSSSSPSDSSKAIVMECGSFKVRSMRKFDRMSSVLIRSLSQLRIGQSSSTATANGHGVLPC